MDQVVVRQRLFLRMWAIATSFTSGRQTTVGRRLPGVGGGHRSGRTRASPASATALGSMIVFQVVDYLWEMPYSPDHWALILAVNLRGGSPW